MSSFIVQPDTLEKEAALKAFLKALKINFKEKQTNYSDEFIKKIKAGEKDIEEGRTTKVSLDDIWK